MDQLLDQWMDGSIDRSIKWSMNRWIDGLSTTTPPPSYLTPPATTDFTYSNTFLTRKDIVNAACLCLGSVSAVPLVSLYSSEWNSLSAREGGANLAVSIRTSTSCKCRRRRRFVFYAFLWTCRKTEKSQALKIVYRAYAGRWRGGRWSEKCQLGRCTNQRWGAQARTHKQYVFAQWFVDITDFFPDTTVFTIKKLVLRTSEIKR